MLRFARATPLTVFRRFYATEAEYKVELKAGPDAGNLFKGKMPFLCHFTSVAHPQLVQHNKTVKEEMAGVNKDDVLIKYLVANIEEPIAAQLMQQLHMQQAPAMAAFADGKLLDTLVGMTDDAKVKDFISKFLSFTGKAGPAAGAPELDDIEGDGVDAQFARYMIESQKTKKTPQDSIAELTQIIVAGEEQIADEKKNKKTAQKKDTSGAAPTATKAQETVAAASLVLAELYYDIKEQSLAKTQVEKVKKDYARFKIPAVMKSLNMLEMSILTDFDGQPAQAYAQQVVANPEDITLQLRLAVAMFKETQFKESIALMLQVLKKHRAHEDGLAKKLLLAAFAVLGPQNDITIEGKKKMMAYLF